MGKVTHKPARVSDQPFAARIFPAMARSSITVRFYKTSIPLALILLLCPMISAEAAFEDYGPDPISAALCTSLSADAFHFPARASNPAAGCRLSGWGFSASWCKPFNLSELEQIRIDIAHSLAHGWVASLRATTLGGELYSERTAGLSLSRVLLPELAIGIGLNFNQLSIERYGSESAPSLDAGLLYRHRLFDLGVSVTGLYSGAFPRFGGDVIARRFLLSGALPLDESTRILIETSLEDGMTPSIRAGFEVRLFSKLILRGGYETVSERISLGLGLPLHLWQASAAFDHHPALGWSRSAGLMWKRNETPSP